MKVAYVFRNDMSATFQLASMILPQLEAGNHGVEVLGMRLSKIAEQQNILIMICDQCALRRGLAEGNFSQCGSGEVKAKNTVSGVVAGCFPQLYNALSTNLPDQVITL